MYNTYGKENTKEEEVKGIYILLSGTLAVVTSAVSGTTRSPVVDVRCNCIRKPIVLTMLSSGIRVDAWEWLKWKHIIPIDRKGTIVAVK